MIKRSSMKDATRRVCARANGVVQSRGEIGMEHLLHKSAEAQILAQAISTRTMQAMAPPHVLVDPLGNSTAGAKVKWPHGGSHVAAVPSRARRKTAPEPTICQSRFSIDFRITRMRILTVTDTPTPVCVGQGLTSELTPRRSTPSLVARKTVKLAVEQWTGDWSVSRCTQHSGACH